MADPEVPAGWYPDPSRSGQLRWWDGAHWTDTVRAERMPWWAAPWEMIERAASRVAAWPRERMLAAAVIGGLVLTSLGVIGVVVLATGRDAPDDAVIAEGSGPPPDTASSDPGTGDEGAADDAADGEATGGEAAPADEGTEESEEGTGGDREPTVIDFDGVCEVDLDPDEMADPEAARPWHFPACDRAPIRLDGTDGRWIVVVASLDGGSHSEQEALERAREHDLDEDQVLWSSHYPSLNPGLWVVFDGPYPTDAAATAASERLGGGSYPRLVSDDDDDRYCIAADGCVGEGAD